MYKTTISTPSYEKIFLRNSLFHSALRLDGRSFEDLRAISLKITRDETSSSCEVQWGNTIIIVVVSANMISPFPDRPNEGILQFNTELSAQADANGYSHAEISRYLEKIIRDSETIDTESLSIVGGEKVWEIRGEVRIVDASGGNLIDASVLAAIAALKAFRKPEISVISTETISENATRSKLAIHHSDERDPLPLALHHTPLTLTLGIFKRGNNPQGGEKLDKESIGKEKFLLIVDPSINEEAAMDGSISYSVNAFGEFCAVNKPGGISLPVDVIMKAAQVTSRKIEILHQKLSVALEELEQKVEKEREVRLNNTRLYRQMVVEQHARERGDRMEEEDEESSIVMEGNDITGIDKDDPILQWSNLHYPVNLH